MRTAIVLALLIVATPAHAWQPPSGGPSKMAKRVLDSLPDPTKVAIPHDIEERSRAGGPVATTGGPPVQTPAPATLPSGCWEVQLTAVTDADRARVLADQESQRFGHRVRVVVENGLSKLRAGGDCLRYDEATTLRDRMRDSGYPGAFVIRSSGAGSGS